LNKVPTAHFDSDQFPPHEGLAAWRHMTASLYQTWPRGEPEGFRAQADGYKVGELVFNQARFTPARFLRGPELLVGEGREFLSLQMQLVGEERLIMTHGHVRLLPGHIYLRDWAYAFESEASTKRLHAVMIPRHRLRAGARIQESTPLLCWSMSEPDGRLLSMLWQELITELGQVTLPQALNLCNAFLGFLDALLGYNPDEANKPRRHAANPADAAQRRRRRRGARPTLQRLAQHAVSPVRAAREGSGNSSTAPAWSAALASCAGPTRGASRLRTSPLPGDSPRHAPYGAASEAGILP
jgi:hypothetical protein